MKTDVTDELSRNLEEQIKIEMAFLNAIPDSVFLFNVIVVLAKMLASITQDMYRKQQRTWKHPEND